MINDIKFIYFDIGGVLLEWKGILKKIAKLVKKDETLVEAIYYKYDAPSLKGQMHPHDFWKNFRHDLNLEGRIEDDFYSFTMRNFTPIRQTHDLVKKIHRKIPVGILSNIYQGVYDLSLKHGHIPDIKYHTVVQSCNIRMVKPDLEIYLHAQKLSGALHKQILFIDDVEENLYHPRRLGWSTFLFDTSHISYSAAKLSKITDLLLKSSRGA